MLPRAICFYASSLTPPSQQELVANFVLDYVPNMAGPTNVASPLASEPKENGQVGTAAGDEERAGGASEGHEAADAANGKHHPSFKPSSVLAKTDYVTW